MLVLAVAAGGEGAEGEAGLSILDTRLAKRVRHLRLRSVRAVGALVLLMVRELSELMLFALAGGENDGGGRAGTRRTGPAEGAFGRWVIEALATSEQCVSQQHTVALVGELCGGVGRLLVAWVEESNVLERGPLHCREPARLHPERDRILDRHELDAKSKDDFWFVTAKVFNSDKIMYIPQCKGSPEDPNRSSLEHNYIIPRLEVRASCVLLRHHLPHPFHHRRVTNDRVAIFFSMCARLHNKCKHMGRNISYNHCRSDQRKATQKTSTTQKATDT